MSEQEMSEQERRRAEKFLNIFRESQSCLPDNASPGAKASAAILAFALADAEGDDEVDYDFDVTEGTLIEDAYDALRRFRKQDE